MPFLISYCLAIIGNPFQAALLSPWQCIILTLLAFLLLLIVRYQHYGRVYLWVLLGLLVGIVYSNLFAASNLQKLLPKHLEQQDLVLLVSVASTPSQRQYYWRTTVKVIESPENRLQKIRLDWYGDYQPKACELWQVTARLKQPHGLANPGSWNARLSLLENNIQATAYVREATKLSDGRFCRHRLREQWHNYVLSQLSKEKAAWLIALSTGDKSFLSAQQYRFLQESGINHLFVISGLHIGLAAGLVYALIAFIRRLGFGFSGDWRPIGAGLALIAAIAYAGLADFVIPTQRALITLIVFFSAQVVGLRIAIWLRYWLAMAVVLTVNPLSSANIGFALSFAAVALLIICAQHIQSQKLPLQKWRLAIASQFYIALGLSPLLLWHFNHLALSGPWINLFAIPVVSFLIIPLVLLGFISWLVLANSFGLLILADVVLQYLFLLIDWVNQRFAVLVDIGSATTINAAVILLLATLCALLALPRYLPGKLKVASLLVLTILLAKQPYSVAQGAVRVQVLDVGQGLAILVRTANHQLLYDTGSAWANGSMVQQVVQPVLGHYAIAALDKVVISHFDNDHAGGWPDLYGNIPVKHWLANKDEAPFSPCYAGQAWHWDGVDFEIVSPNIGYTESNNDTSCVLLITVAGRHIVLPGDISKAIEMAILMQYPALKAIDVLIAPHHGSSSSSSYPLVDKTKGAIVVFSAGYLNRYQHPHPSIVERYQAVNAKLLNTAVDGMVSIDVDRSGNVKASSFRRQVRRYWDAVPANHLEY